MQLIQHSAVNNDWPPVWESEQANKYSSRDIDYRWPWTALPICTYILPSIKLSSICHYCPPLYWHSSTCHHTTHQIQQQPHIFNSSEFHFNKFALYIYHWQEKGIRWSTWECNRSMTHFKMRMDQNHPLMLLITLIHLTLCTTEIIIYQKYFIYILFYTIHIY